jgi:hypothetical protein
MASPEQHGVFGSDPTHFVRCLPRQPNQLSKADLAMLALEMEAKPDTLDAGPDAEENMYVPAGYTYFGQFIDHDLSFDTTSTFDGVNAPTTQRTPRLDLDCVYGRGPADAPEMYEADGVMLRQGTVIDAVSQRRDLPRGPDGRAIIGDPRNDENSIVSQIQAAFIRFHNRMARQIATARGLGGAALFHAARQEVTWTYQRIVVEDYLPRIIRADVIAAFDNARQPNARGLSQNTAAYKLYVPQNRAGLPIEFAGAAYRFGHSMVRNGYMLQDDQQFPIFDGAMDPMSLVGFQPLPPEHVIRDWVRFFPDASRESATSGDTFDPAPGTPAGNGNANDCPDDAAGAPRLQYAYRIDTAVVNPLASLPAVVASDPPPSLLVRNLWRGAAFQLPTGQDVAARLGCAVPTELLVVRDQFLAGGDKAYRFRPVAAKFANATPLWFYILAEAQKLVVAKFGTGDFTEDDLLEHAAETGAQLGEVGGRILLEVFHGLLDSDPESLRNHPDAAGWTPSPRRCGSGTLSPHRHQEAAFALPRSSTTKCLRTGSTTSNTPSKPAGITQASPAPNVRATPCASVIRSRPLITWKNSSLPSGKAMRQAPGSHAQIPQSKSPCPAL